MSPIDKVIPLLTAVRRAGKGFSARCPAHEDRGPSLSITEGDDGRVLMHCFAGCSTAAVLGAIGLQIADLFLPNNQPRRPPPAPGVSRTELHAAAEFERTVIRIVQFDRAAGRQINSTDLERERIAKGRIAMARKVLA